MHDLCDIEMLDVRRDRHVCHEMYRAVHDMAPEPVQNMFTFVKDTHSRETRSTTAEHLSPKVQI